MSVTVAATAATAAPATVDAFPSGIPWSLYYHATYDSEWHAGSYKFLSSFTSFSDLWAALKHIKDEFPLGMYFMMKGVPKADTARPEWEKGNYPPMWEHKYNIHGGAYCVKVVTDALNTFQHYAAGAVLNEITTDVRNPIVGVSISPKKGFFIMKLWNLAADDFKDPRQVKLLLPSIKTPDILYRPHGDAKM